ncbi:MAG: imidazole glycerol phosphate synthase subunit HisF [Aureispira sp.]|nr:imidazole glycerol phosphate synthase subunit HisF [Aureispira sp.]
MLTKRIIPCLDIKDGRTVKGINFKDLRDAGNPVDLAKAYSQEGADELIFLDITASHENRRQLLAKLVREIARGINIPFTVGGGIQSVKDVDILLHAGADKITINSAAVRNPKLIEDLAKNFGSQCVVVAIDAKQIEQDWTVFLSGGRVATDWTLLDWAKEAENCGAGEIMFTSMNHDGTKNGFADQITAAIAKAVSIPIIASGGAGKLEHFKTVLTTGKADAALAASIFHFGEIPIPKLKQYLQEQQIPIRPVY